MITQKGKYYQIGNNIALGGDKKYRVETKFEVKAFDRVQDLPINLREKMQKREQAIANLPERAKTSGNF